MRNLRYILNCGIAFLPWAIKRRLYTWFFGYNIHKTARIGYSLVMPKMLVMGPRAAIGHGNIIIKLEAVEMDVDSYIGRTNWITGYPKSGSEFQEFPDRQPILRMGKDAAISKNHHVDCTDLVEIDDYSSIGGYGSQFLTHSTSLATNSQGCSPIRIGRNCFVGTRIIMLPGAELPDHSVLAAGAVLNRRHSEQWILYGGVPAKKLKDLDKELKFLTRTVRPK